MNFNDEIVSIDILDEEEMIDIEVSGDHLFFGDGILVSNSIGIPAVCDLTLAITRTSELDELNQLAVKQLKNRYHNMTLKPKFILGVDTSKQTLYDVSESEQTLCEETKVDNERVESKFKGWKKDFSGITF